MRLLGSILIFIVCSSFCFAEVNVYLYPRVTAKTGGIVLSDIAKINADADTAARISAIVVDDRFFTDGYIDRKELEYILKDAVSETVNIYGSGVRISAPILDISSEERPVVRKGSPVRFQVTGGNIRVELAGTAMKDGAVGEVIPVKLRGTKISNGKIVNERVVELAL